MPSPLPYGSRGPAVLPLMSVAEGLRLPAREDSVNGDRPKLSAVGVRWFSMDGRSLDWPWSFAPR